MKLKLIAQGMALVALLALAGCEDPQARSDASSASNAVAELKKEIAELRSQTTANKEAIDSLQATLGGRINDEAEKMKKFLDEAQSKLDQRITDTRNEMSKTMADQFESTRSDFDNRLRQRLSGDVAQNFQAIRDEVEKNRKNLLGYMDQQLKELYPYAYQPRRMDPNAAPEKPQE